MLYKSSIKNNLKEQAIISSWWGMLDKGLGFFIQFGVGIALARLLPPSDFGLIGLAMIVIGFGEVFVRLGLDAALIQKEKVTERHVRVVFTVSVIIGVVFAILILTSTSLFGLFFNNEKVVPILQTLSILFVIIGCQIPSQALLIKRLHFKQIFFVSMAQVVLYGVSTVTFAAMGYGVWSLVIGNICLRSVSLIGSYIYVRHSIKPLFVMKEFLELGYFGSGETLSGIFNYFALKGDYLIIGKFIGEQALGLYTKAYGLMQVPTSRFVNVISNILFPTASRLQSDNTRLRKVFLKSMNSITFSTLPLFMLLLLTADKLVIGLYGLNWEGAVVPLQILSVFGVFRAMYSASASFLKAKGLVFKVFWAQVAYATLLITLTWQASLMHGLTGASWAVGFSIFIMWCIMMELNCRAIGLKRREIILTFVPGLILGLSVLISVKLVNFLLPPFIIHPLTQIVILLISGLTTVLISIIYLPQTWFNFVLLDILSSIENTGSDKLDRLLKKITIYISGS